MLTSHLAGAAHERALVAAMGEEEETAEASDLDEENQDSDSDEEHSNMTAAQDFAQAVQVGAAAAEAWADHVARARALGPDGSTGKMEDGTRDPFFARRNVAGVEAGLGGKGEGGREVGGLTNETSLGYAAGGSFSSPAHSPSSTLHPSTTTTTNFTPLNRIATTAIATTSTTFARNADVGSASLPSPPASLSFPSRTLKAPSFSMPDKVVPGMRVMARYALDGMFYPGTISTRKSTRVRCVVVDFADGDRADVATEDLRTPNLPNGVEVLAQPENCLIREYVCARILSNHSPTSYVVQLFDGSEVKCSRDRVMLRAMPLADATEMPCGVCGNDNPDDDGIICDGCSGSFHFSCVDPPITRVPAGDWFCMTCEPRKPPHQTTTAAPTPPPKVPPNTLALPSSHPFPYCSSTPPTTTSTSSAPLAPPPSSLPNSLSSLSSLSSASSAVSALASCFRRTLIALARPGWQPAPHTLTDQQLAEFDLLHFAEHNRQQLQRPLIPTLLSTLALEARIATARAHTEKLEKELDAILSAASTPAVETKTLPPSVSAHPALKYASKEEGKEEGERMD